MTAHRPPGFSADDPPLFYVALWTTPQGGVMEIGTDLPDTPETRELVSGALRSMADAIDTAGLGPNLKGMAS